MKRITAATLVLMLMLTLCGELVYAQEKTPELHTLWDIVYGCSIEEFVQKIEGEVGMPLTIEERHNDVAAISEDGAFKYFGTPSKLYGLFDKKTYRFDRFHLLVSSTHSEDYKISGIERALIDGYTEYQKIYNAISQHYGECDYSMISEQSVYSDLERTVYFSAPMGERILDWDAIHERMMKYDSSILIYSHWGNIQLTALVTCYKYDLVPSTASTSVIVNYESQVPNQPDIFPFGDIDKYTSEDEAG